MARTKKVKEAAQKRILAKEALILYIKARRPLWDLTLKDYKNLPLKAKLYIEVFNLIKEECEPDTLKELSLDSAEGVKTMWKNLRSTYQMNKKRRRGKSGAGSADMPKPWVWQELMSFLDKAGAHPNLDSLRTSSLQLDPSSQVGFFYQNI